MRLKRKFSFCKIQSRPACTCNHRLLVRFSATPYADHGVSGARNGLALRNLPPASD